jgi:hypothetical protein
MSEWSIENPDNHQFAIRNKETGEVTMPDGRVLSLEEYEELCKILWLGGKDE